MGLLVQRLALGCVLPLPLALAPARKSLYLERAQPARQGMLRGPLLIWRTEGPIQRAWALATTSFEAWPIAMWLAKSWPTASWSPRR